MCTPPLPSGAEQEEEEGDPQTGHKCLNGWAEVRLIRLFNSAMLSPVAWQLQKGDWTLNSNHARRLTKWESVFEMVKSNHRLFRIKECQHFCVISGCNKKTGNLSY